MEGWVFCSEAVGHGPVGEELLVKKLRGQFLTNVVRKQIKRRCVFQAGEHQMLMWGPCAEVDVKDWRDAVK